jgi:hypothetical protein
MDLPRANTHQRIVGFCAFRLELNSAYSCLELNVTIARRNRSAAASVVLGLSCRFELGDQLAHVLWHRLLLIFVFVAQRTANRHNRGSPKLFLFFFILVVHAEINGTNRASFRCYGTNSVRSCSSSNSEVPMTPSVIKDLYHSSNGDRWTLCRDTAGNLLVSHQPNEASGGLPNETAVDVFLSFGGQGPECQALRDALADPGYGGQAREKGELSAEATDRLSRALGEGVARSWSIFPQDIQHRLFEAAVMAHGEEIRQDLAVYCMASTIAPVMWDNRGRCPSRIVWEGRR